MDSSHGRWDQHSNCLRMAINHISVLQNQNIFQHMDQLVTIITDRV